MIKKIITKEKRNINIYKKYILIPFILFQLFAILFFAEVTIFKQKSFLTDWDGTAQTYPWFVKNFNSLKSGTISLWDFSTYSGSTFIGEMQTAPFYPITALFAIFYAGEYHTIDYWIVFHFGLASFFMFLFLIYKDFSKTASVIGAIIFAFVGSVANRSSGQANIFAGLVYLPLVLLVFEKAINYTERLYKNIWAILGGILLGFCILAGHMQPCIHIVICMIFYGLYLSIVKENKKINEIVLIFLFILSITILFASIQLFPTIEYLKLANRWYGPGFVQGNHVVPYSQYGFHSILEIKDFDTLLIPKQAQEGGTLYFTQIGLMLSLFAFFSNRKIKWFALLLTVFSILFAMGDNSTISYISYYIPIINKVREPIRILFLYNFAVALFSALGYEKLRNLASNINLESVNWAFIVGIIFLMLVVDAYRFTTKLPIPITHNRHPITYYKKTPIVEFLEKKQKKEKHLYRFVSFPNELLPPNIGNVYNIFSARGHRATMLTSYFDYLSRDWNLQSNIYDNLSVKYVITREKIGEFKKIFSYNETKIYERPNAKKMFRYAEEEKHYNDLNIKKIKWGINHVEIEIENAEKGTLIFAQPYYSGWIAKINGKTKKINKYDIFNSIEINSKTKNVIFQYQMKNIKLYLFLNLITIIYLIVLIGIKFHHYVTLNKRCLKRQTELKS